MKTRLALFVCLLLFPAVARAQAAVTGWPGLNTAALPTVYVRDTSGAEVMGTLLRFEADAVVLLVDGAERRIESSSVQRIQRRGDSLKNGALIGLGIGVGLGIVTGGIADCPSGGSGCAGGRVALMALSTAMYTAIATAMDAATVGRTTIYVAPAPRSARAGITFSW